MYSSRIRRMQLGAVVWAVVLPGYGQTVVAPDRIPVVKRVFEAPTAGQLRCEADPMPPKRDFRLRFISGYRVRIPLTQINRSEHGLTTYVRVTPEGRGPVYLMQSGVVAEGALQSADAKAQAEIAGNFIVGEGKYGVEVLVQDGMHRTCRSNWQIQAERTGNERQMQPPTPSGAVESMLARTREAEAVPRIGRVTILLHAGPVVPSHSKMQPGDIQRLTDSLVTVTAGLPARAVRLIAFNLEQRSVIFRSDHFTAGQKRELSAALGQMKLGTVNYKTLQQEPISVLADLIKAEMESAERADAVIVLGPRTVPSKDVPATAIKRSATPLFSLQLLPAGQTFRPTSTPGYEAGRRPGIAGADSRGTYGTGADNTPLETPNFGEPPDPIQRLIGRLKGETIPIQAPHDLANAIRRMDGRIPKIAAPSADPDGEDGSASAGPGLGPGARTSPTVPATSVEPAEITEGGRVPASALPGAAEVSGNKEPDRLPVQSADAGGASAHGAAGGAASGTAAGPVEGALPLDTESVPEEDPVWVLMQLRDRVVEHGERIPNHLCVESIQRDRYEPVAGQTKSCGELLEARRQARSSDRLKLSTTDWLRLDVAFLSYREMYSWAGANKFEEAEIDELIPDGAMGTGAFAGILLSLFAGRAPKFTFEGQTKLEGRRVFEYRFAVPQEQSHYRFRTRKKEWVITGYAGTLLVDPKTNEIARLVLETEELPASTHTCQSIVTLEYGIVKMEGDDYLLPKMARQRFIGRQGSEDENRMTFSSCRQFQSESKVAFGESAVASGGSGLGLTGGTDLPAAVPVSVELTSAVRVGEAAAGDRIQGRLIGPIRDGQQRTIVAAGALVEGRLMRVETDHRPSVEHTVALRWEAMEIDGKMMPVSLTPDRRPVGALAVGGRKTLQRRGMEIQLPLPGEERYAVVHLAADHPVLQSGYRTEWLTAGP